MASNDNTWSNLQTNKTNLLSLGNDQYQYYHTDWIRLQDVIDGGEREVKEKGVDYLSKTSGMESNTCDGDKVYEAYKNRAIFYGYAKDTLPAMLGVMHAKPAAFELPGPISFMNEEATSPESWRVGLQQVLREINRNQLAYGRYGILADIPATEKAASEVMPKLIGYEGFYILDWSTRESATGEVVTDYVLLAEEAPADGARTAKCNQPPMRLRILALDGKGDYYTIVVNIGPDDMKQGANCSKVIDTLSNIDLDNPPTESSNDGPTAQYPEVAGKRLQFIPFVFINVTNLMPDIEKSPLLQLANMDISIYSGDADWAQAYFLQGQDTLVVIGVQKTDDKLLVGAGGGIHLSDKDADAKFIGVSGDGLGEMRERATGLMNFATQLGISLVDQNQPESGKALETRSNIKNAPLKTVAMTGAKGLLQALRYAAYWKTGEFDTTDTQVTPNLDFSTSTKAAKELMDLFMSKQAGAPISMRDVHKFARDNNFSDKTFEETAQEIREED